MNLAPIPADKANHLIAGLLVYLLVALLFGPTFGLAAAIAAGAAKEAADRYTQGHVEALDFLATCLGGVLGWACTYLGTGRNPVIVF
jgi:hypothetical protein